MILMIQDSNVMILMIHDNFVLLHMVHCLAELFF